MVSSVIIPPNTALVDRNGRVTPEWYRYFVSIIRDLLAGTRGLEEVLLSATGVVTDYGDDTTPDLLGMAVAPENAPDMLPPVQVPYAAEDSLPSVTHAQVNVDETPGLIEQTGFDSFTKRAMGVANATDVLTRADGDGRYIIGGGAVSANIRQVTSSPTLAADDHTLLCDATGGAITVALPSAASSAKRILAIKKVDAGINAVTIDPNGAELIDGAASLSLLTQWQAIMIQCDGAAWFVI